MSKRSSETEATNPSKKQKALKVATKEEWLKARKEILAEEKKLSRATLALAAKRQAMPWVEITTAYEFTDVEGGKCKLADLFKKTDELVVYHLMYQDNWEKGCSSCSAWLDSLNGAYPHIAQRTNLVCVGKASHSKLARFAKDKGWEIPCYSSLGSSLLSPLPAPFRQNNKSSCTLDQDRASTKILEWNFPKRRGNPGQSYTTSERRRGPTPNRLRD